MVKGFAETLEGHESRVMDRKVDYSSTHKAFFASPPEGSKPARPIPALPVPTQQEKLSKLDRVWDESTSSWVPGTSKRRGFHNTFYGSNWGYGALNATCVGGSFGYEGSLRPVSADYGDRADFPSSTTVTALGSLGPRLDGSHLPDDESTLSTGTRFDGISLYRTPRLTPHATSLYHSSPRKSRRANSELPSARNSLPVTPSLKGTGQSGMSTSRSVYPTAWAGTRIDKLVHDVSLPSNARGRYNIGANNYEDTLEPRPTPKSRYNTTAKTSTEEMLRLVKEARSKGLLEMQKHGYAYVQKKRDDTQVSRNGPDFFYIPHVGVRNPEAPLV